MLILRNSPKYIKALFFGIKKTVLISTNLSQDSFICGTTKLQTSTNTYLKHYLQLNLSENKVLATYVWIDGSGINMRCKDRILEKEPCDISSVPRWSFDGSSTGQAKINNSDILLIPSAIYRDPFRKSPHVIVLCETYGDDGKPTKTNNRAHCAKVLSDLSDQEPWFGIEQEFTMFDADLWPLGWPKTRGYPVIKSKYSYCGIGVHVAGREIVECHTRACIYSGMDYEGSNAEVMKGSWEFQIGTTLGVKAADDLWMGRFLLGRIAEQFGVVISYHPKPMGKYQPGIGCHHNFSTKTMRNEEGITEIERVCKLLCDKHKDYIKNYGLDNGIENKKRLTGEFETASYESFRWGVADRSASVRLQRNVLAARKGFLEDRRPSGDCDPYKICALLAETSMK